MNRTERSELRRLPERGSHDPKVIHEVLDAAFLAHVGFNAGAQPFVIPMIYGRDGSTLYLHGSTASRTLLVLTDGAPACVSVTLIDGLVLARSAFHHSLNYRSVVAFGTARAIAAAARKTRAMRVISEHLIAGRWRDVRGPSRAELTATTVLEFTIEEVSAKIRRGPPTEDEADYASTVWAGVVPLVLQPQTPIADPRLAAGIEVPTYVPRGLRSK
jgi:nitroimidazol reductase NimA-like FMN-containing flavoprotein (pyridoxamine 5'-phosphate oxidase superfamily)